MSHYNDNVLPSTQLPIHDVEVGMQQVEMIEGYGYRVMVGPLLIHVVGPPIGGGDSRTIAAAVARDLEDIMTVIRQMERRAYMPAQELRNAIFSLSV